jgi:hypothetical protein
LYYFARIKSTYDHQIKITDRFDYAAYFFSLRQRETGA